MILGLLITAAILYLTVAWVQRAPEREWTKAMTSRRRSY